jgi:ABC-type transport system substrate-binding protein
MPSRQLVRSAGFLLCASLVVVVFVSCAPRHTLPKPHAFWVIGSDQPAFDPDGPPDERRWAIEHLLTRGLVEESDDGRIVLAAAESLEVSTDSLTYTFRLRSRLTYVDGSPCTSADFKRGLLEGLQRGDHSTRRWLLASVRGVDAIRLGHPFPEIAIDTPDDRTIRLRLAVRDPDLMRKLAVPGTTSAWKHRDAGVWREAVGLGPYQVLVADSSRIITLVRGKSAFSEAASADTLTARFAPAPGRVRALMRDGRPDLVWPTPPGLLSEPLPPGYRTVTQPATPTRWLVLIMRADLPPTTKLPARHALAHGINRPELMRTMGVQTIDVGTWMPGLPPFDEPRLDPFEIESWRERGKLGRSFHVIMAYDTYGPAADVARNLQGEWSVHAIYVELLVRSGTRREAEFLGGRSHLVLTSVQDLIDSPSGRVAPFIMPLRGPAVGAVRTGWRTREFDDWLVPGRSRGRLDPSLVQRRFEEERIVLPLARLPWVWVERAAGPAATFHPRLGPEPPTPSTPR